MGVHGGVERPPMLAASGYAGSALPLHVRRLAGACEHQVWRWGIAGGPHQQDGALQEVVHTDGVVQLRSAHAACSMQRSAHAAAGQRMQLRVSTCSGQK